MTDIIKQFDKNPQASLFKNEPLKVIHPRKNRYKKSTMHKNASLLQDVVISQTVQSTGKYKRLQVLGSGSYGEVFEAIAPDNTRVAIKRFLINSDTYHRGSIGALRELDMLSNINHSYINCIVDVIYGNPFTTVLDLKNNWIDDKIYIVSDLANYTCHDYIQRATANIAIIKRGMYQTLSALYALHSKQIAHRDIKPRNILCFHQPNSNNNISNKDPLFVDFKLADFGLSKPMNSLNVNSLSIVTLNYRAPELILGNYGYTNTIDIWSLGCVFYEMVMKRKLFNMKTDMTLLTCIFKEFGTPQKSVLHNIAGANISEEIIKMVSVNHSTPKTVYDIFNLRRDQIEKFNSPIVDGCKNFGTFEQFCDLFSKMMQIDPSKRLTAWECLQHPFFNDIPTSNSKNDGWGNLCKQTKIEIVYHKLQRNELYLVERAAAIHYIKILGSEAIKNKLINVSNIMNNKHNKNISDTDSDISIQGDRIIFLALDIFDRCLLKLPSSNSAIDFDKIALVCGYIAAKYFLCDDTPPFKSLFPKCRYTFEEIETTERLILEKYLKFRIYRLTVYDLLEYNVAIESFFNMFVVEKHNYDGTLNIHQLAQIYNSAAKEQLDEFIKNQPSNEINRLIYNVHTANSTKKYKQVTAA